MMSRQASNILERNLTKSDIPESRDKQKRFRLKNSCLKSASQINTLKGNKELSLLKTVILALAAHEC
jgi:hypothetical protein